MGEGLSESPERFGPFVLLRELGAGGMGSAYLARHADRSGFLVVKRLHRTLLSDPTVFKRFVHEAEVASHVQHENVAALVAMGSVEDEPFLATEHVYGLALSQIVDRVENSQIDQIPMQVALHMAIEITAAVEAIHEARHRETGAPLGLLHRDVGARNVLIGFDGRIRLIDLGLGKSILSDWQTNHQVVAGSPDYMAPEQAMGGDVDTRADVYAAAVTIWELFAGRKRIRKDSIAARLQAAVSAQPEALIKYRPEATPRLEAILKNAMAYDPTIRTASIAILRKTLEEEVSSFGKKASQADVKDWLDGSCATLIAKERRLLEAAGALGGSGAAPPRANTQMYVGQITGKDDDLVDPYNYYLGGQRPKGSGIEGTFARIAHNDTASRIAKMVDPERLARSGPAAKFLLFGGILLVLILVAAMSAWMFSPPDPVVAEGLPSASPPNAAPAPTPVAPPAAAAPVPPAVVVQAPPTVEPPPTVAPPAPPRNPTPPPDVTAADLEAKRQLLARIKRLRRSSFDVDFQRQLTRLSSRLSKVRSRAAYLDIERRVKRLEQR